MKIFFLLILFIALLFSCPDSSSNNNNDNHNNPNPNNPNQNGNTFIVFDNSQGICTVVVYDNYQRRESNKIAEIPAGNSSTEIEWLPSTETFFLSYLVKLNGVDGFILNYIPVIEKNQIMVRIDENIINHITIPVLEDTISSADELLSNLSYILIQNNSSYSFRLHRGILPIDPDNTPHSNVVNSGDRAQYSINPDSSSNYSLLFGSDNINFPSSLVFEAGHIYSFVFDGSLSLIKETAIVIENVAMPNAGMQAPQKPNVPTVVASDGMITMHWTAVDWAENYEIYLSTEENPPAAPVRTVLGTAVVITGLTNKTIHYIWIKAVNELGSSDFSNRSNAIPWPINEVPAVPERPVIISGVNQLTINWEISGGAEFYEVYININTTEPAIPEITTNNKSVVIDNLIANTVYYIWIRAVNNAGKSDYSQFEAGTPRIPTVIPNSPEITEIKPGNRELKVFWEAVELAAAYEVWIGTNNNSGMAQLYTEITGYRTEAAITGLVNETVYFVWVKAKNNIGTSSFSNSASAIPTPFAAIPETPEIPMVSPGNRSLIISWTKTEGAIAYELWISTTGNIINAEKYGADIVGTIIEVSGLTNSTTYYVWIRAKNNLGISGFSGMTSGRPTAYTEPPVDPQSAPILTIGSRQITVTWQTVAGALSYEIWIGTTSNPQIAYKYEDDIYGLTTVITNLTNETTYYIWLKAKNNFGTSGFSPLANGKPSVYAVIPVSPSAPTVVNVPSELIISWLPVEGALSYELWRGLTNNSANAVKHGNDLENTTVNVTGLTNGTTYYFWVKAKNDIGVSGFSSVISGTPIDIPKTPQLAPNIIPGNEQLIVSWQETEWASVYELWVGTTNNSGEATKTNDNINGLTTTISGLTNNTAYYVWIKAKNSIGTSDFSPEATGIPLANISGLNVIAGNGQINISWNASVGADSYEIYYSTNESIPNNPTLTGAELSRTITGLTNGTTYYFWVKPKNTSGTGATSSIVSGRPIGNMGAVTVTTGGNRQLVLSWSAVAGADGYDIYYSTISTIPNNPSQTTTTIPHTINGLDNGMIYYFWIIPKNNNGTGGVSPVASGSAIPAVENLTVVSSNQQINLGWTAISGANNYEIYYSTTMSIPETASSTVNEAGAIITGLTNGITYYLWVKAVYAIGTSNASPIASGKPVGDMGDVDITTGNSGQLLLSWNTVAGADQYEVFQNTTNSIPLNPVQVVTTLSATINGLTNGTTYYFWVRGKNTNGTGNTNTAVSGKPLGIPSVPVLDAPIDRINISWTAVPGADEYEVYFGIGTADILFTTTMNTSTVITDLTYGATYTIIIRAKNSTGTSDSQSITATPSWAGLYRGVYIGEFNLQERIGGYNLGAALSYISSNNINGDYYYIVIGENESIAPQSLSYSGRNVNITLIGIESEKAITLNSNGNIFSIGTGVTLTLDENITLVGRSTNTGDSLVTVNQGATFIINEGTKITGNTSSSSGGGIFVTAGTFIMNGGEIYGNTISIGDGGGVYMQSNGHFTMNGGKIHGNSVSYSGGGVFVTAGTFIMNNGEIYGNTTGFSGGGVCMRNGHFKMNGGKIYGNSASYSGGGVYIQNGAFIMSDGEISSNSASSGGGVQITAAATFTMSGGEIYDNIAIPTLSQSSGGGVNVYGTFIMSGGKISGNTAAGSGFGGGVCVTRSASEYGAFTMSGGEISGNIANFGGGVCLTERCSFTMSGGEIYGNTAGGGGGVWMNGYAQNEGIFRMSGGVIYGSNAETSLRNINVSSGYPNTAAFKSDGNARYGTFIGNYFISSGIITNTNNTIRIVDGNLLTE